MQRKPSTSSNSKMINRDSAGLRIIRSRDDHSAAIARLSELMAADPLAGTPEADELDVLALLIAEYEKRTFALNDVTPVDAIRFRMDQENLTRKDLEQYLGSASRVSEILSGARPLSIEMIRRLRDGLGISADVLIERKASTKSTTELAADQYPLQEMLDAGCFHGFKGSISELKASADRWIAGFFKGLELPQALCRAPQVQKASKSGNEYAFRAWRACVIKKARQERLAGSFDRSRMSSEWFRDLVKLSMFENGPKLAKEYLGRFGIPLVVQPHFKGTYLDGAAMLDGERPVVAMTLRYDRIDNFWFVLMHELAHVKLHLGPDTVCILDNLDSGSSGAGIEEEADTFAQEALIPQNQWNVIAKNVPETTEQLCAVANDLGIAPQIVAGRIRKETGNYRLHSGVIGKKGQVSRVLSN